MVLERTLVLVRIPGTTKETVTIMPEFKYADEPVAGMHSLLAV